MRAAGDRDGIAGPASAARKGLLEALLHLPHPAEVDQEPAMDAEEALVEEALVVVGLGEADLARVEENPAVLPLSDDPARNQILRDYVVILLSRRC